MNGLKRWGQRWREWWRRGRRNGAGAGTPEPEHLRRGRLGEEEARAYLEEAGLKFLAANVRDPKAGRGEVDLVFRDRDCLVFVEVKARTRDDGIRPAAAVDAEKRRLLSDQAMAYLRKLSTREVKWRFDIVEVLWHANGELREVRHLVNAFPADPRYQFW